jgi:hypothetical protein
MYAYFTKTTGNYHHSVHVFIFGLAQSDDILNEFHEFRSWLASQLLELILTSLEASVIFDADGAVVKLGLSLKSNHRCQI